MTIPDGLEKIIMRSLEAIKNHPQHDLNLGYRHLVWTEFGPHKKLGVDDNQRGLIRRVNLAILSTRYVLPLWENVWPEDKSPQFLLDEAQKVLSGDIPEDAAWNSRNQYWEKYVEIGYQEKKHQITLGVGFSAVQTLTASLQDEVFEPSIANENLTDVDIDPDQMDSSFFSSAAYSDGAIWETGSSADKRKDFWEWWLCEAVITAWNSDLL